MAKNIALIPGERSNWEIAFFLLIDAMVPFLKPNMNFDRQDIVSEAGMSFLHNLLGSIGYEVNKTLEHSLQGTINTMVKKRYIISDFGRYTLTPKGYERLNEIRDKYNTEKKEYIGKLKDSIDWVESLSEEKIDRMISSIPSEAAKKLNILNLTPKEAFKTIIKSGYHVNL
jgi:DNA-binding PadR family transcriptional regulator